MVFQLARTFKKPAQGQNAQRGFPAPGAGDQTTGDYNPAPQLAGPWTPQRPIQGRPTFFEVAGQRGFPAPNAPLQRRPPETMPNQVPVSGLPRMGPVHKQDYGAAAYAPQYGKVLTNPIGAGVVARYRPQASYGSAAQYVNGAIWWTSQGIPTSVSLTGLTDPAVLAAVLGPVNLQAAIRVG